MRIVVTGAAGFVGSHLVDRLLAEGHDVLGIDDLSTGSLANLRLASSSGRFRFRTRDVRKGYAWTVDRADRVYHLACPASPVHYQRDPVRTIETAFLGTRTAIDLARSTGARLLVASTSEVYGDPLVHPQPESYWGHVNPVGARSCYDEGKRAAEALCVSHAMQGGLDVRIARIFNTYGPRMATNDGRLLPNLITQAIRGEPLTVYGDGQQTRSLCFVSDTVKGLAALMEYDGDEHPVAVNIGNPDERTIRSIAEDVARMFGGRAIAHKPLPQDDPRQRRPDITIARALLGWEPRVAYETGIAATVEWFRSKGREEAA